MMIALLKIFGAYILLFTIAYVIIDHFDPDDD